MHEGLLCAPFHREVEQEARKTSKRRGLAALLLLDLEEKGAMVFSWVVVHFCLNRNQIEKKKKRYDKSNVVNYRSRRCHRSLVFNLSFYFHIPF